MSKFTAVVLATTMLVPAVSHAEGEIEVLHHWVSQSAVDALNVTRKELEAKGFQRKDSAVGGMRSANAQQALRTRLTAGDPPGAIGKEKDVEDRIETLDRFVAALRQETAAMARG